MIDCRSKGCGFKPQFLIEQDTILRLACADAEGDRGPDPPPPPPLENHKLFTRLFSGHRAWAPLTKFLDPCMLSTGSTQQTKGKVSEKLSTFSDGEAQRKKGDELNVPGVN